MVQEIYKRIKTLYYGRGGMQPGRFLALSQEFCAMARNGQLGRTWLHVDVKQWLSKCGIGVERICESLNTNAEAAIL